MSEVETRVQELYSLVDGVIRGSLLTRDQHQEYFASLEYLAKLALLSVNENQEHEIQKIDSNQLERIYQSLDVLIGSKTFSREEHSKLAVSLQWLFHQAKSFLERENITTTQNEESLGSTLAEDEMQVVSNL